MTLSFFFDESGHSGDLIKSGVAYDFLDQPFFVLAALGIEDEGATDAEDRGHANPTQDPCR